MDLEDVLGEIVEAKALAFASNEILETLNQTANDYQNNCSSAKATAEELTRVSESVTTIGWLVLERLKHIETQLDVLTDQDAQNN